MEVTSKTTKEVNPKVTCHCGWIGRGCRFPEHLMTAHITDIRPKSIVPYSRMGFLSIMIGKHAIQYCPTCRCGTLTGKSEQREGQWRTQHAKKADCVKGFQQAWVALLETIQLTATVPIPVTPPPIKETPPPITGDLHTMWQAFKTAPLTAQWIKDCETPTEPDSDDEDTPAWSLDIAKEIRTKVYNGVKAQRQLDATKQDIEALKDAHEMATGSWNIERFRLTEQITSWQRESARQTDENRLLMAQVTLLQKKLAGLPAE